MKTVYCFGPFRLDSTQRLLIRGDGERVKLVAAELSLLLALIEHPREVVEKEILTGKIWRGASVGPTSLAQAVLRLRKKLGVKPSGEQYIETIFNHGYSLTESVWAETVEETPAPKSSELEQGKDAFDRRATETVADIEVPDSPSEAFSYPDTSAPDRVSISSTHAEVLQSPRKPFRSVGLTAAVVMAFLVVTLIMAIVSKPPIQSVGAVPLTDDGAPKAGLLTDGKRLYFTEAVDKVSKLASVPLGGGEVTRHNVPGINLIEVLNARMPGPEFLLSAATSQGRKYLWRWRMGETPIALFEEPQGGIEADWIEGALVAITEPQGDLRILDGTVTRRVISLDGGGIITYPRWSHSRQLLRFTVVDPLRIHHSIWQMAGLNANPEPVPGLPAEAQFGNWGLDTPYFAFMTPHSRQGDVWAIGETHSGRAEPDRPRQLTNGTIQSVSVLPSPDGPQVFAIGAAERSELVRFDEISKSFIPYLDGRSALELDYSRDGGWIVYSKWPERTLWRARADGRDGTQIVGSPMTAIQPHWSPDGSQIAFMGQYAGGPSRIYLLPTAGGTAREAVRGGPAQGVPTWSRDGNSIVFGDLRVQPYEKMSIHLLDLHRGELRTLPGSIGRWTPRWSPDGNYISAVTVDYHSLDLFDCRTQRWHTAVKMSFIEDPAWTADSQFLYFRGHPIEDVLNPSKGIYRVSIITGKLERVADLDRFPVSRFEWYGLTHDGKPLALRTMSVYNIFSIAMP